MLYIPKIDDYLKILTDEGVKDFAATNFSEYFKSTIWMKIKILEKLLNCFISFRQHQMK